MDEILYWIHTKRAPCLFKYDKSIKQHDLEGHRSITKPVHYNSKSLSSPKNNKRKLVMFDDSESSIEQQNIFFEPPGQRKKQIINNTCKSDSLISDVDFNIKNSSVQNKWKKPKLQKNTQTVLHKKNKVITSTPIINRSLRRSLRKVEKTFNNSNNFHTSFELLNDSGVNHRSNCNGSPALHSKLHTTKETNDVPTELGNGLNTENVTQSKKIVTTVNGQFEDVSDVSGFTANYIRSTKLHYSQTPRMLRTKVKRNLVKESKTIKKENSTVVCVNKSMNTNHPVTTNLNSVGSSQNVFHLITNNNNTENTKVSTRTSALKCIKLLPNNTHNNSFNNKLLDTSKQTNATNSFQHRRSPRYPKRHQNHQSQDLILQTVNTPSRRKVNKKNENELYKLKGNSDDLIMTRRRSRRHTGLKVREPDSSVLVLSNGGDQESSLEVINVASDTVQNKKQLSTRKTKHKKSVNEKESLREKSGFAACFSDSDDEPLKSHKFFC